MMSDGSAMQLLLRPLLHQGALFVHVVAFAVTLSAVLHEDLRWWRQRSIDAQHLKSAMRTVSVGLAVLWASGLVLVGFAATASPGPWVPSAKLSAKLVVVSLLTLNGWVLHARVFPRLLRELESRTLSPQRLGALPVALGAFSSASWIFASFLGVARPLAPVLPLAGFMALYVLSVGLAGVLAWRSFAIREASTA
jgi:hypothetical protein